MPDIRHLTFERFPKALYGLVIARGAGAGHTLSEPVFLYHFFCFLCRVLAASVNLRITAQVALNDNNMIHILSEGYPTVNVDLHDLSVHEEEKNTPLLLCGVLQLLFRSAEPI